ncbi:ATP-dependent zinc metalloprotease FtsH [Actinomadura sp. HBU206391]|uniref:ATP-dependent zinc metalloprotease FtsH n=1 Tax=Actinomadura sp. HBU206391 TaxID=2731692 RepID=UPI00164EEC9F|nr:ATP-dependent zinc metalloprotease FtsH [Actinomadura sp. HBU206391]MBC6459452.1 ATP-dependent metallopeptidase FtsH/Yme1/Tma family protein [Actinomadura sp. HBU206391]
MTTRVRLPFRHATRSARPRPPREPPRPPGEPPPTPPEQPTPWQRWLLPMLIATMFLLLIGPALFSPPAQQRATYSDLMSKVNAGQVSSVSIDDKGGVQGKLTDGRSFTSQIPTALGNTQLAQRLEAKHVQITATRSGGSWSSLLLSLLPLFIIFGLFLWLGRHGQQSLASGIGGFGRSKAKIIEAERPTTRFTDVAGYDGVKQEISEMVDFLRDPGRYSAAGAKPPRGVIMVGPPGTGKTLLARAVAGEAEVAFLSVTGSAFVEMFVGVGASRVRDMFDNARKRAPSIIFIDEIDAIGGKRGGIGMGGHEEREQTLNQLLAEMDGFDQGSGIVVLAATNRPESLDAALLRPGRFDRQVTVPLPNQSERAAILSVHAMGKRLAPDVDLDVIARGTPGFSGADLANLANEGAINAVRAGRTVIDANDLDQARDRVLLGRREASNALLPDERHAVAVHESGHALLAALCEHADPVAKVTILPAGVALGVTEQLPEAERHLYSEAYLIDLLTVRLGGRAAELVVFGQGSTGAANDLAGATQIAGRMVREFGLSPALGPVGYGSTTPHGLGEAPEETPLRLPYSEHTQELIDAEVASLLRHAEQRATGLLDAHRGALDRLAATLLEDETVDGDVVVKVLRNHPPADGSARRAAGRAVPARHLSEK